MAMDWRRDLVFVVVVAGFFGSGVEAREEERPAAARGMEVVVVVVVAVVFVTRTGWGVASLRFLGERLVGDIGASAWLSSLGVVSRLRLGAGVLVVSRPFDLAVLTVTFSPTPSFRGLNRLLITLPTAPSLVAACSASIAA